MSRFRFRFVHTPRLARLLASIQTVIRSRSLDDILGFTLAPAAVAWNVSFWAGSDSPVDSTYFAAIAAILPALALAAASEFARIAEALSTLERNVMGAKRKLPLLAARAERVRDVQSLAQITVISPVLDAVRFAGAAHTIRRGAFHLAIIAVTGESASLICLASGSSHLFLAAYVAVQSALVAGMLCGAFAVRFLLPGVAA